MRKTGNKMTDLTTIPSKQKTGQQDWVVSYADVVTVLLCFFILFFNSNTKATVESTNHDIEVSSLTSKEVDENIQSPVPLELLQQLEATDFTVITKRSGEVFIDFKDVSFFSSGSFRLTKVGQKAVTKVADTLKPFKESVFIEIQGHADATPMKTRNRHGLKSNLELSTQRALTVYKTFDGKGFNERNLAISGFSNHIPTGMENQDLDRRVTFRVKKKK